MLLRKTARARLCIAVLAAAACLALPACGLRYDESSVCPVSRLCPGGGCEHMVYMEQTVAQPAAAETQRSANPAASQAQTLADEANDAAEEAVREAADAVTQAYNTDSAEARAAAEKAARAAEEAAAKAARAADAAVEAAACEVPERKPSFFGIRFDNSGSAQRAAAAACQTDPCLQPSISEQRKAKADAKAAAELKAANGDTQIKPDGSSSNPSEVKFVASPGALNLDIEAAGNLNALDGVPHALILVVYHLSDRTAYDQLTANTEGIRKLLNAEAFDASVKSVRTLNIQPGMQSRLSLERAEDGRYVAFVAGYNRLDASASLHVATYGIGMYSKKNGLLAKSTSMFCPLPLNLKVRLGSTGMTVSPTEELFDNVAASVPMQ